MTKSAEYSVDTVPIYNIKAETELCPPNSPQLKFLSLRTYQHPRKVPEVYFPHFEVALEPGPLGMLFGFGVALEPEPLGMLFDKASNFLSRAS